MIQYEVGKPFPTPLPSSGDGAILSGSHGFVDVIIMFSNPRAKEIRDIKQGMVTIGVFTTQSVPFIILKFIESGIELDPSYNASEVLKTDWLQVEQNTMTIYLVDTDTKILKAMRVLGLKKEMVEKFKVCASRQNFETKDDFDMEVLTIYENIPLKEMYLHSETQTFVR